jgi:hypothetical protein
VGVVGWWRVRWLVSARHWFQGPKTLTGLISPEHRRSSRQSSGGKGFFAEEADVVPSGDRKTMQMTGRVSLAQGGR